MTAKATGLRRRNHAVDLNKLAALPNALINLFAGVLPGEGAE
jgi:hypothetical protein